MVYIWVDCLTDALATCPVVTHVLLLVQLSLMSCYLSSCHSCLATCSVVTHVLLLVQLSFMSCYLSSCHSCSCYLSSCHWHSCSARNRRPYVSQSPLLRRRSDVGSTQQQQQQQQRSTPSLRRKLSSEGISEVNKAGHVTSTLRLVMNIFNH